MKFFKPNFANKSVALGQKAAAAAAQPPHPPPSSSATAPNEPAASPAIDQPARLMSPPPPKAAPPPMPADMVDAAVRAGESDFSVQQPALNSLRGPVDLDEDSAPVTPAAGAATPAPVVALLSDGGEDADDEGEDDSTAIAPAPERVGQGAALIATSMASVGAGAAAAGGIKRPGNGAPTTLFQRKRPAHHGPQQQPQNLHLQLAPTAQQQQQQQQGGRRPTPCGSLRSMRMRDLIYWCPKDQPPPKWRRESQAATDAENTADQSLQQQQQQQQQQPPPQQVSPPQQLKPEPSLKSDTTGPGGRPAPQVMLDSRGNIVLNEESLYIRDSAPAIVEDVREDCAELRATYRSFRPSGGRGATRGRQWSYKETLRFYKAVSTIGTDFSYMASLFKGRSREELKRKYKREEKANPHLIDQMLRKRKAYDLTIFEPSSDSDGPDDDATSTSTGRTKTAGGGSVQTASKPSDIVMEGLKRHLQANQLLKGGAAKQPGMKTDQAEQQQQQDQAVSIVFC